MKSDLGLYAESLVARYLSEKGYEILDRNFRRKWGEIDLVAKKEGILVFVEVKASGRPSPGFEPELRAGKEKMKKVLRSAKVYLAYKKIPQDSEWQMDIVAVTFNKEKGLANIKHFKNI